MTTTQNEGASDMNWDRMTVMFERLSAMQKCIRRGMTDDAGYWFFALCEIGFTKAALTRLRIIAHEDVGTGDITTATSCPVSMYERTIASLARIAAES